MEEVKAVNRHLMITWILLLCILAASACGPTPTSLPSAPAATLVSATPTGLPSTGTPVATPQPTLEPVTSRFLYVQGVTVSTLAGDGHRGYRDGPAAQARFSWLGGVAVGSQGDIYVVELLGNRVRRITSDGTVSTLAGTGAPGYADGPGSTAQFSGPESLEVDDRGNVYVADTSNHRIRVIRPDGMVSTLAGDGEAGYRDGPAAQAQFNMPTDVAVDTAGVVYVADRGNNRIRAISPEGMVSTLAGSGERGFKDGPPDQAQFDGPFGMTVDVGGNVYIADGVWMERRGNNAVRRIAPDGTVTTLAGTGRPGLADGPTAEASLYWPEDVAVDEVGNVYVAESSTGRIRVITPQGMVYTLAGNGTTGHADGPGPEAAFFWPNGIALDGAGRLYVTEGFDRIRVIHLPQSLVAAPPSLTPDPYAGQNAIKIGFVAAPWFGHNSAAPMMGAQLAVDEANATGGVTVGGTRYTLALVTAQDWYLPSDVGAQAAAADAQAAARALLAKGVVAVVGHVASEASMAAAEVYGPAGVVMVSALSSDPRVTQAGWPAVYRVTSNDAFMAPVAARMTYEELGIRRAVLLGEADPHVRTAMDAWQRAFESLGGQVLGRFEAEVEFPAEELAQLKTLAPEAVILFPPRRLMPHRTVQQVQETGVEAVIIGVESFSHLPFFLAVLGEAAEGVYDAVTGRPRAAMPGYAGFAERYREASFPIMPDPDDFQAKWAPFGYDAAGVIIAAVRQAAEPALPVPSAVEGSPVEGTGAVTRESVAAAMETFRDEPYQGVIGPIQFDGYGDLLDQPVYFKKVVNGQWVDVMPGER
jgi:ABC-type branched-subunit amino acid transport system substrate-binding protein/sugar lactone lactonase YvrE